MPGRRKQTASGWTRGIVIAIFGGGELDLSSSPPCPDARLTVVAILGGFKIFVAPETRVSVGGFGLFGGRDELEPGEANDRRGSERRAGAGGGLRVEAIELAYFPQHVPFLTPFVRTRGLAKSSTLSS